MTKEDAKKAAEAISARFGGRDIGDLNRLLLTNPALGKMIVCDLGFALVLDGKLPADIREVMILFTAKKLKADYQWMHHVITAKNAGVSDEIIAAIYSEKKLHTFPRRYCDFLILADVLLERRPLVDEVKDRIIKQYNEAILMEASLLCGFYQLLAAFALTFSIPLPAGKDVIHDDKLGAYLSKL